MSPPLWNNEAIDSVCAKIVAGLPPTYSEALKASRALFKIEENIRSENFTRSIKVALGGNVATDFLETGIQVGLASLGIDADIYNTNYDNWIIEALEGEVAADFWVVWISSMGASRGGVVRSGHEFSEIRAACEKILAQGSSLVAILPESLEMEDNPFSPFRAWREDFSSQLREALPDGVIQLPIDHLQRKLGSQKWFAPRYWTMGKAPCHPDGATLVALEAAKTLSQSLRQRVKAVICDLDDTLWGGVIGEDGLSGIKLDPFGEGRPFLSLQKVLKDIQATGIPLNVVSKNEFENAREPFDSHTDMILKFDDFVHFEVSWEPKHIAIRRIAESLNLGLDSICFLDNSTHERNEAKNFIPELIIPELSKDPEQRVRQLVGSGLFFMPALHDDDIERVERYRQDIKRQNTLNPDMGLDQYLDNLAMRLTPLAIDPVIISRAEALVQKTNQFNLSNRRHTSKEILSIAEDDNNYAFCFSLSDKFGDSGIISVVLGRQKNDKLVLDTFVLSCRVFGRGVEQAILDHLFEWMGQRGVILTEAEFVPSSKNFLVKEFLTKSGSFTSGNPDGSQVFTLDRLDSSLHKISICR